VRPCDWKVALNRAPTPCSQRQGSAALGGNVAAPLPHFAAPLLLPSLQTALEAVCSSGLPLPHPAAAAASKVEPGLDRYERHLTELGAVSSPPLLTGKLPRDVKVDPRKWS
jgi:hypothetical protein